MKSDRRRIGVIALFIGMATLLPIAEIGKASPAVPKQFSVSTKSFALNFWVGDDGRLYQRAVGAADVDAKMERTDEGYPPAGDGYVWEPALQVIHADGNTSTALLFEGVTRTNDEAGREWTQIQLHDPAYPLEVTLNFGPTADAMWWNSRRKLTTTSPDPSPWSGWPRPRCCSRRRMFI